MPSPANGIGKGMFYAISYIRPFVYPVRYIVTTLSYERLEQFDKTEREHLLIT